MTISIEIHGHVALVTLNRPEKRNALNSEMLDALLEALTPLDASSDVGCLVITGDKRAFAAGADIHEMSQISHIEMVQQDYFAKWAHFSALRTPKIAAVSGIAFGGGCELAMMCDLIFAAESATFAQPEIKLGVMPGIGATQRLTRLVGQANAMDLILTGRTITAALAHNMGLISRVFPDAQLLTETMKTAEKIASYSQMALNYSRQAILAAQDLALADGLKYERNLFHSLFATEDQSEGMAAFLEKRPANFTNT